MPRQHERQPVPAEPVMALGRVLEFLRLLWAIDHGLQLTSKRMSAGIGLTGLQRLVVRIVGKFPGVSAGKAAAILHLDPSTLTPVLHHLADAGLLQLRSDPRDGRRLLLGLTARGRALDAPASDTVEASVGQALAGMRSGKIQAAEEVLTALARALDGTGAPRTGAPALQHKARSGRSA